MTTLERNPELRTIQRRIARFDRVSSFVESLVVLVGLAVLWLAALWLASRIWPARAETRSMEVIQFSGEEEGMAGDDPLLGETPAPINENSMADPSLLFEDTDVTQVLSSVLDAASEQQIDLSDPSQVQGDRSTGIEGSPGGLGKRGSGAGAGGRSNEARWDIRYPSQSLTEYAQVLDFFKIELGVVRPGKVEYISDLSKNPPTVKEGSPADTRLYFQWRDEPRRKADLALLAQKGIATAGAIVVQFFPADLEARLLEVERQYAGRPVEEIKKTRFGIRPGGAGFEIYVIEQAYVR